MLVRQSAKDFDSIIGLAGAGVDDRHLILRHSRELLVTASADLLQFLECLIVTIEILETEGGVVARKFPGIHIGILVGYLDEFLHGLLRARGLIGIERRTGIGGGRKRGGWGPVDPFMRNEMYRRPTKLLTE